MSLSPPIPADLYRGRGAVRRDKFMDRPPSHLLWNRDAPVARPLSFFETFGFLHKAMVS